MIDSKYTSRILRPKYLGKLEERAGMRLSIGMDGDPIFGAWVKIYLLIDEQDGIIADASFSLYGPPLFILAADILCELVVRKTYKQAARVSSSMIEARAFPFPKEDAFCLNQTIWALDQCLGLATDIQPEVVTPIESNNVAPLSEIEASAFAALSKKEKLRKIEAVIDQDIRPYVELDEGGVEIRDLHDYELTIAYQGACNSCYAAAGSTLSSIQGILQQKLHPQLQVTPVDLAF